MFEDLKQQNNPPLQASSLGDGKVLPMKIEQSVKQPESRTDAEDMLAGVAEIKPKLDKANINRPFLKEAAKDINDADPDELKKESNRKRFIFIGISAAVIIFIASFFIIVNTWDFFSIKKDEKEPVGNVAAEKKESLKKEETESEDKKDEWTAIKQADMQDADKDGLSDEEEGKLGTSINNVDTDDDGLSDREEIKVYKTDPLNFDTDGDNYKDGVEVKGGYNPKGEGKLMQISNF